MPSAPAERSDDGKRPSFSCKEQRFFMYCAQDFLCGFLTWRDNGIFGSLSSAALKDCVTRYSLSSLVFLIFPIPYDGPCGILGWRHEIESTTKTQRPKSENAEFQVRRKADRVRTHAAGVGKQGILSRKHRAVLENSGALLMQIAWGRHKPETSKHRLCTVSSS